MIKNITGYTGFKSYGDKPYSNLKPGQIRVDRDYYKEVNNEQPSGKEILQNFTRFSSTYSQNQNQNVQLGDYKVPAKSMNTMVGYEFIHNPQLFNNTHLGRNLKRAESQGYNITRSAAEIEKDKKNNSAFTQMTLTTAQPTVTKNINPTSHWQSHYTKITNEVAENDRIVSHRPLWSINRVGYSSSRGLYQTEFSEQFGKLGHNPRQLLPSESVRLENRKTDLTVGTTKVTSHIPGYHGFIPQTDSNQLAVKQSSGTNTRNTIIKQNIVENLCVKLPGYQGHKPISVMNDRGTLRPSCLSTHGESFQ